MAETTINLDRGQLPWRKRPSKPFEARPRVLRFCDLPQPDWQKNQSPSPALMDALLCGQPLAVCPAAQTGLSVRSLAKLKGPIQS